MANSQNSFFHWYKRYKVRAQDMNDFQDAMAQVGRGLGEASLGAAILKGFGITPGAGLSLNVDPGIATAASGYLQVINDASVLDVTNAAVSGLPCRSLIVVTPDLVDSDFINSPTTPFTSVPLRQLQKATVKLIMGNAGANPEYPAKGVNDVIICGLIIPPSAASITTSMLDFEVRESIGVNSLIAQNQVRFDNRMRPFRSTSMVLGIKPSQNIGSSPLCFSYPGRLTPSLFPLNAGSFNPIDTFIDFSTGVISGGDTTTPSFTPVISDANGAVIAVVTLTQKDTLNISFGDLGGTYDQCLASIKNQVFSGPGSLPSPDGNFGIAYVILTSYNGALSDLSVFDGRPFLGSGAAAAKFLNEVPSGAVNSSNNVFQLSKTPADPESLDFYVESNKLEKGDYTLNGTLVTITNSAFIPAPGQSVYAKYLIFGAVSNNASSGVQAARFKQEVPIGTVDGSNANFTLSSTPVDNDSIDFYVNENHLEITDFTVAGNVITIINPDFIPQPGQGVYVKYLYLGFLSGGGGGGGGTSGYSAFGNRASPIVVNTMSGLMATSDPLQSWFVKASSGATLVSATPQITPGVRVGQVLKIKICDGVNFPVFQDGNGVELNGDVWPATGQSPTVLVGSSIEFSWDGTQWSEDTRR